MKVAIISDIHDHIDLLKAALKKTSGAGMLLCCGDLCSPFIVDLLGQNFADRPIHIVFGNNDGDLFRITTKAGNYPMMTLHGELAELEIDRKRVAMSHFDNIGRALAASDRYDLVCFGHNHQFEIARNGETLVVNPGEVMGGLTGESSFVLYDSAAHQAEKIAV